MWVIIIKLLFFCFVSVFDKKVTFLPIVIEHMMMGMSWQQGTAAHIVSLGTEKMNAGTPSHFSIIFSPETQPMGCCCPL